MKAKHLVTVGLAAVALTACNGTPQDPYTSPRNDYLSKYGTNNQSVLGEGGLSLNLFGKNKDQGGGPAGIGVNTYLWRASLDTVSFMPLASADPFGGVIITDWYSPPDTPNERFKVNIFILDRQLRADGIRAAVFRQRREADGRWQDVATDATTQTEMENAILARARQLRVSTAER
ncbi:MAG TPA: DUF3576 domain-containing protein [Stellaceae bacterium]